jgi:NAD(P)-dependent dehydrogenase (short-subunit alcohol dehydrogenase family)
MLVLGTPIDAVRALAVGLGADLVEVPLGADDAALEAWRAEAAAGPPVGRVVVAPWVEAQVAGRVDAIDPAAWDARAEQPLAAWVAALGAAVTRCADGGAIVAVVERPSPLDCAGWAPESGVADAVEALTRSLGRSEGPRGVRVNAVTTPTRFVHGDVVAPPPPLASFPGTVERDVVGAVRLLLSDDAGGLTGTVAHADAGRSWR